MENEKQKMKNGKRNMKNGKKNKWKIKTEGSHWCSGLRHAFNISSLRSQVQSPVLALIFI
jgi:hypothetical protein